ncbi:histidine kinase dimerization/phospho-acceptor domain-containing protein, partial [Oleiphilus sp. HI0125]
EEDKVRSIAFRLAFAICIVILIFVGYAFFLVRRVTQLNAESQRSIDEHGRIEKTEIQASKNFPDEIGDLSRAITQLLQKQRAYTSFLERIPQTLRHEISNPLNKLKTSIELLTETQPELKGNRYLERIDAGADQLHQITAHLTEAASLESAMQSEQLSSLDLTKFLHRYFDHWEEPVHVEFEVDEEFQTLGDASRLEQMFDKIMDN